MARLRAVTIEWLRQDVETAAIWSPVAIGIGVGVYFGLKTEPPFAFGLMALAASLLCLAVSAKLRRFSVVAVLICIGFVAADLRVMSITTPVLDRDLGFRAVEGRIVSVERSASRERFVIAVSSISGLNASETPARLRLTWRGAQSDIVAGDSVKLRAGLSPPPPPAVPGGFDFARQLYFLRIGGVGFAVTPPEKTAQANRHTMRMQIENVRSALAHRITDIAPGQGGAIVAAVVTGKRDAISEEARSALRDAGLAHLLAISGLHMGLATGLIFFAARAIFAAIEPIAIRFPTKKWAAVAALAAGFAYLLLSGASWSPRRAFIMTAIMLTAVLFDRRALSLRNVAIAATVILLTTPEALVHPGFQMSFAAATALIAAYEWWREQARPEHDFSLATKVKDYAIALIVTDVVASLATAPFALYHFNRVAVFSLPANVLAMPLMAFWIMPAAAIGVVLAPFGLDAPAWAAAAYGVDVILSIGGEVSSWPGAVSFTPQWPVVALMTIVGGGLWFALARSPLRYAGVLGIPVAAAIISTVPLPDIFISSTGKNVGVVVTTPARERQVAPFSSRREKFAVGVWNEYVGGDPDLERRRIDDIGECGRAGCVFAINGKSISIIQSRSALAEDCARADLVIAMFAVWDREKAACAAALVDRRSVWDEGAHAIRQVGSGFEITTNLSARGRRPWTENERRGDQ